MHVCPLHYSYCRDNPNLTIHKQYYTPRLRRDLPPVESPRIFMKHFRKDDLFDSFREIVANTVGTFLQQESFVFGQYVRVTTRCERCSVLLRSWARAERNRHRRRPTCKCRASRLSCRGYCTALLFASFFASWFAIGPLGWSTFYSHSRARCARK